MHTRNKVHTRSNAGITWWVMLYSLATNSLGGCLRLVVVTRNTVKSLRETTQHEAISLRICACTTARSWAVCGLVELLWPEGVPLVGPPQEGAITGGWTEEGGVCPLVEDLGLA